MTNEEKELLRKDLCARLPYGVKMRRFDGEIDELSPLFFATAAIENFKPYLRPLSSMTEEEEETWKFLCSTSGYDINERYMEDGIGWLHKHHLDYRNLIRKGLALEAPEGMYKRE